MEDFDPQEKSPVFILGVHRSGTSLLRNLLDGHPALYTVPIESHFPHCMGVPTAYPRRRVIEPGERDKPTTIDRMASVVEEYNSSDHRQADAYLPGAFRSKELREHLNETIDNQRSANDLYSYVDAIAASLNIPGRNKDQRVVEKSVDNIEHAWWLKDLYPNAKFIFIIRDPYTGLRSFRQFIQKGAAFPSLSQPLRTIEFGFYYARLYEGTLPGLLLIRYEDLLRSPELFMRKIAGHLQIDWNEFLLKPTSMGRSWGGNSGLSKERKGVDATDLEKARARVLPLEIELINRSSLFEGMRRFGYEPMPSKNAFLPAKGEGPKTYLRNRLYRLFSDGS